MTVSGTTNRDQYAGNGATTTFARTFLVTDEDHLKVYTTTGGVRTEVTSGISKTGIGTASGNVVFDTAPATGTTVTLIREVPLTQETDYSAQGVVSPEQVEDDLDLSAMRLQDQQEVLGRTLKLPVTSELSDLELPTPVAGRVLAWNAEADALENITGLAESVVVTDGVSTMSIDGVTLTTPTGAQTLTNKTMDLSANTVTVDGTNAVGYRNIPQSGSEKTTGYTLVTGDVGKLVVVGTSGGVTIPDATFAAGDAIVVANNTSGDITITCTITTAYIAGVDTDKATVTLATRGVCNILFLSGTVCLLTGNIT